MVLLGGSEGPARGSAAGTPTGAASGSAGPADAAGCLFLRLGRVLLAGGAGCKGAGAPAAPVPLLLRVRLAGPEASLRSASLRLAASLVSITLSRHGASHSKGGLQMCLVQNCVCKRRYPSSRHRALLQTRSCNPGLSCQRERCDLAHLTHCKNTQRPRSVYTSHEARELLDQLVTLQSTEPQCKTTRGVALWSWRWASPACPGPAHSPGAPPAPPAAPSCTPCLHGHDVYHCFSACPCITFLDGNSPKQGTCCPCPSPGS